MGIHWEAYLSTFRKGETNKDLRPWLRKKAVEEVGVEAKAAAEANYPEITNQVKEFFKAVVRRRRAFDE